jgi:hypothetical protein
MEMHQISKVGMPYRCHQMQSSGSIHFYRARIIDSGFWGGTVHPFGQPTSGRTMTPISEGIDWRRPYSVVIATKSRSPRDANTEIKLIGPA